MSLSRGRSSLAVGNVVGAAISNILGAFSLGLLFRTRGNTIGFDKSSKIYSVLLLLLTTFVAPITFFARKDLWRPCGGILIGLFAIYVTSIVWAIGHGRITPPEASDSEGRREPRFARTSARSGGNQDFNCRSARNTAQYRYSTAHHASPASGSSAWPNIPSPVIPYLLPPTRLPLHMPSQLCPVARSFHNHNPIQNLRRYVRRNRACDCHHTPREVHCCYERLSRARGDPSCQHCRKQHFPPVTLYGNNNG